MFKLMYQCQKFVRFEVYMIERYGNAGGITVAIQRTAREGPVETRIPGSLKAADVEYRVVLNKAKMEWNVFRNGAATDVSARKKKTSAVDSAIRDAKAESTKSNVYIIVTCIEGRKIETVWTRP
jgi:hypothetical protein